MKHPRATLSCRGTREKFGEVAERSIAADCKSAGLVPTEVRTLPSPPLFPTSAVRRSGDGEESGGEGRTLLYLSERQGALRAPPPRRFGRERRNGLSGGHEAQRESEERGSRACRAEVANRATRASHEGGSNSVVESQPSKLLVAGSIPVSRSSLRSHLLVNVRFGSASQAKAVSP
jgi:hypothetical protein